MINLKIKNNHPGIESLLIPIHSTKGLEIQAEVDPVIEKTMRMRIS